MRTHKFHLFCAIQFTALSIFPTFSTKPRTTQSRFHDPTSSPSHILPASQPQRRHPISHRQESSRNSHHVFPFVEQDRRQQPFAAKPLRAGAEHRRCSVRSRDQHCRSQGRPPASAVRLCARGEIVTLIEASLNSAFAYKHIYNSNSNVPLQSLLPSPTTATRFYSTEPRAMSSISRQHHAFFCMVIHLHGARSICDSI